jgi:XTP/dITP diphosphohydrolase
MTIRVVNDLKRKLYLASSNRKAEGVFCYRSHSLADQTALLPGFSELTPFPEAAPTFAENAVGKALQASRNFDRSSLRGRFRAGDSALGGEPGVRSALQALTPLESKHLQNFWRDDKQKRIEERAAHFVCVRRLRERNALAVISNRVDVYSLEEPRGSGGFGYDQFSTFLL